MGFSISLDKDACNGCEECIEACSTGVFEMRDGQSFPAHAAECIGCESCVEICEQNAISVEESGLEMSDTCRSLLRGIL